MKRKSFFNCTQQELYLLLPIAWLLCRIHLARFMKHKGFYTEGYIDDRIEEVKTAKAIPSHNIRKDTPVTNKSNLDAAIEDCCHYFILLVSLMETAFDASSMESKLDAAGEKYFEKSESGNEGALEDLNTSALQFIQTNEEALKANNNMTDGFFDDYKSVVAYYVTQRAVYKGSKNVAKATSKDNTSANNALYTNMMSMFGDAKAIFRKEPEIRNLFTVANVLSQVVAQSVAGIRGKVTILGEKKGIKDVKMVIEGRDKVIETNKLGRYDVAQLAAGEYNITFSCKGYKDVVVEGFEVKTGVYNTLDVEMEAIVVVV